MKINLYILVCFFSVLSYSQDVQVIYATTDKIVTVVFPSNIQNVSAASKNIMMDYDKSGGTTVLFLKAKSPFLESNIIVRTDDNRMYNVSVLFEKVPKKVVNIVKIDKANGIVLNNKSKEEEVPEEEEKNDAVKAVESESINVRDNDYTIGNTTINDSENKQVNCPECESILKKNKRVKRVFEENNRIKLQLYNVVYSKGKLYIVVEIENNSSVDFNINYIKTFIDSGKKTKHASSQYLEKNPILIYNAARTVEHKKGRKYVFVYDQFSIDANKYMTFELNESNGERHVFLKISNSIINNPIN